VKGEETLTAGVGVWRHSMDGNRFHLRFPLMSCARSPRAVAVLTGSSVRAPVKIAATIFYMVQKMRGRPSLNKESTSTRDRDATFPAAGADLVHVRGDFFLRPWLDTIFFAVYMSFRQRPALFSDRRHPLLFVVRWCLQPCWRLLMHVSQQSVKSEPKFVL
jgi:hypothetical protein